MFIRGLSENLGGAIEIHGESQSIFSDFLSIFETRGDAQGQCMSERAWRISELTGQECFCI